MNGNALLGVAAEINSLIDTGLYDAISMETVKDRIRRGNVLQYIRELAGIDIDLSIHLDTDTYGNFSGWYTERMQSVLNAYGGNERRKFGVERRGLCLLLAWTLALFRDDEIEWPSRGHPSR